MNYIASIILAVAVVAFVVTLLVNSKKKRWEKVYLGNNDVRVLYTTSNDYWFRDKGDMKAFHDLSGRYVLINRHFTLIREQMSEEEVPAVMKEIEKMRADAEGRN